VNRDGRMIQNQEQFRDANERLRGLVLEAGTVDHRHVPFFCECADERCRDKLKATLDEFEEAHLTSQHYFILPGHLTIAGEESIEQNGRYEVVTKAIA
jgi:hypothetical protein